MPQNFFTQTSSVGVDLNNVSATALFAVGTHFLGTQDTEWVYIQAQTTISGLSFCAWNSTFSGGMASGLDVANGLQLGLSQTSISASSFGWVAIRGNNLTCLVTGTGSVPGGITMGPSIGMSATPTGVLFLNGTSSGSCTLQGVQLQATVSSTAAGSASAGAGFALVTLTWPKAASVAAGG